ncbi:Acyl carrier protein, mitochondrial-like protein [Sarcoptes scabiei]|nr:Acyl carrier protein, mitochondrial-like protein [Sarcoptes scabiei]
MSTHDKIVPNQLKITSHLANDLGLDSLDTVEIIVAIEDEFDISIEDVDVEKIHTVQDIVNFIRNYYETKSNPKENPGHKYLKIQFGPQY